MLPREPTTTSSDSTVIKYEAEDQVDMDIDIKLEFKEEQQEEKEDTLQLPAPFSNEPDEIKNEDCDTKMFELSCDVKEERAEDNYKIPCTNPHPNEITINTKTKPTSPLLPVPAPAQLNVDFPSELKCSYCDEEFPTLQEMMNHGKRHKCTLCDYRAAEPTALKFHIRTHTTQKQWKCSEPQCGKSFTRKQRLEFHEFRIHSKIENNHRIFQCELCPFRTIRKRQLEIHQYGVHSQEQSQMTKTEPEDVEKEQEIIQRVSQFLNEPHECTNTNTNESDFSTERELNELDLDLKEEKELDEDSILNTNNTNEITTTSSLVSDSDSDLGRPPQSQLKCSSCGKKFPYLSRLMNHKKIHNKVKQYQKIFRCEICPYKSTDEAQVSNHIDSVHKRLKQFQCPKSPCSYLCTTKTSLLIHMAGGHSLARPWICPEYGYKCEYAGIAKENLIQHLEARHKKSREEIEAILLQKIHSSPDTAQQNQMTETEPESQQNEHFTATKIIRPKTNTASLLNEPEESTNTNEKEIKPELVEFKYEVQEACWVDESEQIPGRD